MNPLLILSLVPDEVMKKVATEIRELADGLETKDAEALQLTMKRIADLVLEHLEALGLTPEMILNMIIRADEKWASFFDKENAS